MYGTIARYKLQSGHEDQLMAEMRKFEESAPVGWLHHSIWRSTTNPNEIWVSVVFESEAAYKQNASDPGTDRAYRAMLEHLDGEPEWHDGHVIHEAGRMEHESRRQSAMA